MLKLKSYQNSIGKCGPEDMTQPWDSTLTSGIVCPMKGLGKELIMLFWTFVRTSLPLGGCGIQDTIFQAEKSLQQTQNSWGLDGLQNLEDMCLFLV